MEGWLVWRQGSWPAHASAWLVSANWLAKAWKAQKVVESEAQWHWPGWKRLALVCLSAVTLSLPSVFLQSQLLCRAAKQSQELLHISKQLSFEDIRNETHRMQGTAVKHPKPCIDKLECHANQHKSLLVSALGMFIITGQGMFLILESCKFDMQL